MKNKVKADLRLYMNAHQNKKNQVLHYYAFLFAFLAWIFLFINWKVTLILVILHYLFSWIGHFKFEGNKPAAFRYPLIGFYIGFIWFFIRTYEVITRKELINKLIE